MDDELYPAPISGAYIMIALCGTIIAVCASLAAFAFHRHETRIGAVLLCLTPIAVALLVDSWLELRRRATGR